MKTTITKVALGVVIATSLSACSLIPRFSEPDLGAALAGGYDSFDSMTVSGVMFDSAEASFDSAANDIVADAVARLQANPNLRVLVEGHTDHLGDESYNQKLSEQRARAVGQALIAEGISVDRITALGYGESKPVADNSTPEGRSENRRVDIVFAGGN